MRDRGHRSLPPTSAGVGEAQHTQLTLFELEGDVSKLKKLRSDLTVAPGAANTRQALAGDWGVFERWCSDVGRQSLPAKEETVELFAVHCASELGHGVPTIERRLWSIGRTHRESGYESPCGPGVRAVVSGLARKKGRVQRGKAALTVSELRKMVGTLDGRSYAGSRDQAILLTGFSTGMRSAELAELMLSDVFVRRSGVEIFLRKSKTDQEGYGRQIGMRRGGGQLDPVAALERWIRRRSRGPGTLFGVSSRWILHVVKTAAEAAGLDPALYGAHSLRAGMITELDRQGVSLPAIMLRSGHRSFEVASRYVRTRDAYASDPLAGRAAKRG